MGTDTGPAPDGSRRADLLSLAKLFTRLGFTAFGGPAAHISMMHDEVVKRRRWLGEGHFLDLVGATNLIPGPNSTEMAIHIGFQRAGLLGLLVAGASFIWPAVLIVLALACVYVRFGGLPEVSWLLWGIKPVAIAVIAKALLSLGRRAMRSIPLAAVGAAATLAYFLKVDVLLALFAAGVLVMLSRNVARPSKGAGLIATLGLGLPSLSALQSAPISLELLFLTFLKIGAVLYGSGYVLLAFLRADFVQGLGWLTDQQLIDAVAIGQLTPGPVFTTATFIGFLLGGLPGAALATIGIFLPSFGFVALSNPLIPRLRASPWTGGFLDGVNAAAVGLMGAVTLQLALSAFTDVYAMGIAGLSALLLMRWGVSTQILILGGAGLGMLRALIS
jgi:chromate transporter